MLALKTLFPLLPIKNKQIEAIISVTYSELERVKKYVHILVLEKIVKLVASPRVSVSSREKRR